MWRWAKVMTTAAPAEAAVVALAEWQWENIFNGAEETVDAGSSVF